MERTDDQTAYTDFMNDLQIEAEASGEPIAAVFFRKYADLAADNGDCGDLEYQVVRPPARGPYQIDGYGLDLDRGEVFLAISDFRDGGSLETLNAAETDRLVDRAAAFFESALDEKFLAPLEENSPTFQAAWPINEEQSSIHRVRIIVFSNARLSVRRPPEAKRSVAQRRVVVSVFDFVRYTSVLSAQGAPEPIEIDIEELNGGPLPCLEAYGRTSKYASYLTAIPAALLAKVYELYGARLLEQNVRSFLQAKTKVNKGIIETAIEAPEMFFAYNNGLTATASAVGTQKLSDGGTGITSISNLQIVNGGQTTASILYARDVSKVTLGAVYVQMKLTVVNQELVEEVVPKISRFANTQNKVSEADFFSNHPFHVVMEKISRRLPAPPRAGSLVASKWFYERARGQYKYGKAYGSAAERRKFEIEFPKQQVIDKTDLAKYALTFECRPDIVSRGAQKGFLAFAERVDDQWGRDPNRFDDAYFRDAVAKAIVFRRLDQLVGQSDWYQLNRGYKAQIVTYAIAWLVHWLREVEQRKLDLSQVWSRQEVPDRLGELLLDAARAIAAILADTPPTNRNAGEYAKSTVAWTAVRTHEPDDLEGIDGFTVELEMSDLIAGSGNSGGLMSEDAGALLSLIRKNSDAIEGFARDRKLLSPKAIRALEKLKSGESGPTKGERNALLHLLRTIEKKGFELPVERNEATGLEPTAS